MTATASRTAATTARFSRQPGPGATATGTQSARRSATASATPATRTRARRTAPKSSASAPSRSPSAAPADRRQRLHADAARRRPRRRRPLATPAPPSINALTLNPTGTVSPDGFRVGLNGTLSCTAGNGAFISVEAFQFVRGQGIVGGAPVPVLRLRRRRPELVGHGRMDSPASSNPVTSGVRLTTFGPGGFDNEEITDTVRLRRGEPPPESPPQSPPFLQVASTAGAVGGATALAIVAAGMTFGFVRVVRRSERRDHDI